MINIIKLLLLSQCKISWYASLYLIFFSAIGYTQDSTKTNTISASAKIDTIRVTDTFFVFKKSTETLPNTYPINKQSFESERKAIDSIRYSKDSLKYFSLMADLKTKYPLDYRVHNGIFFAKTAAVSQIICGSLGFLFVCIDANSSDKFNYEIPEATYSSAGKLTGYKTVTKTMVVKHKWNLGHTIMSILSVGIVVPAIFVLNI